MADEQAPALNIERVLGALDEHGVKYVMVGGVAATVHGAARATTDLDICPAWDRENLTRLAGALRELGAVEKGTGLAPDVQGLHNMETTCWRSSSAMSTCCSGSRRSLITRRRSTSN